MRRAWVLIALFAVGACRDPNLNRPPPPPPPPACGDGLVNGDLGEECDGSNLNDTTCQSLGFDTGSLGCGDDCKLITSACVKRCGNGQIDTGEECDGKLGPLTCASWGFKQCTADCKIDSTPCGATGFTLAQA